MTFQVKNGKSDWLNKGRSYDYEKNSYHSFILLFADALLNVHVRRLSAISLNARKIA